MLGRGRTVGLMVGLGSAQLVAWGALYYSIAVLAEPMRSELGASQSQVFGAFTWGLVLSGVLAPWAGRKLDHHGGRAVLTTSALVGALGFMLLARAGSFAELVIAWSFAGLAMALGLYDTCFAAIGQVEPLRYRTVVTSITLIAGFASTVSWPLAHYLLQSIGWRGVCSAYAGALLLCAPIYLAVLPPASRRATITEQPPTAIERASDEPALLRRARMLSWAFAGTALIGAAMSAHLVSVLTALQLPGERAVWIASSIGVLQVLGRAFELVFGSKQSATQLGQLTFVALCAAMVLLLATSAWPILVFGFAVLYGLANGLLTIAKATIPVELLGLGNVGAMLGRFGAPSLVARALAPLAFAWGASALGTQSALAGMVAIGVASLLGFVFATRAQAAP